ncbi:FtsX-like permease family protein [Pseudonocardia sp. N23]|uniref:FtsX-like permease family protein n=1 Tax=Pseudonocardia sp. N23 TaxID=1987376 RepID=UPI000BFDC2D7|nr:FtsX-like permease family protein [Pseudonocardia sp. N23]GAY08629.1 AttF component of AttEFGH ABC transport system [Pseudonocardia sp. N23]
MGDAFGAIRAVARAEVRVGWRATLLMGVVFGLVAGIVLGGVGLAGRTASAYPRLVEAVHLDDARTLVAADQPQLAAAVPSLPGVAQARTDEAWIAQLDGPALRFVSIGAPTTAHENLLDPVVVEGRAPARDAADEILLSESIAQSSGLGVGSIVTLRMLTLDQVSKFDVGFGPPAGPSTTVRVVGIGRMPAWGGALAPVQAGPAFAAKFLPDIIGYSIYVRLAADPDAAQRFGAAFARTAAVVDQISPSLISQYTQRTVELPSATVDPSVRAAEQVLVGGLVVFVVVLALGGLQVLGQSMVRHHGVRGGTQRVESALGMRASERAAARVLAAAGAAAVAGIVAGGVALAAGWLEPLGSQARFEPEPGFRPVWSLVLLGGIGTALVFSLVVAATAAIAGRRRATVVPSVRAAAINPLRRWPAALLGTRLAMHGRLGRGGVPAVATVIAASLAMAGVVAAISFGASLQRLVDTPARYGHAADLTIVDAREADIARLVADPRVAALDVGAAGTAELADGDQIEVTSRDVRKGRMPIAVAGGRMPTGPGEVAIGPRLASRLGLDVGDTLEVRRIQGGTVTLQIVGKAVITSQNHGGIGDGAVVAPDVMRQVAPGQPLYDATVLAVPGAADALFAELSRNLEVFQRDVPTAVANLADLVTLPELLALVLAVVAGSGLAHALLTSGRRHAREVAVLSVLGATPGQVRATLAVMAATTVLPALVVGVPLGLGAARVLWWQLATATGVAGDLAVPGRLLFVIVPAVLVAALLLSLAPAARAARTPPAVALATG